VRNDEKFCELSSKGDIALLNNFNDPSSGLEVTTITVNNGVVY